MYAPFYPAPFGHPMLPPPPPPPRRAAAGPEVGEAGPGPGSVSYAREAMEDRRLSHSARSSSVYTTSATKQQLGGPGHCTKACACCKHLSQMDGRFARVETEAQNTVRCLTSDMGKLRRERETAWKHVSELQEQNHLLRQRTRDLEEQNGLLWKQLSFLQMQDAAGRAKDKGATAATSAVAAAPASTAAVAPQPPTVAAVPLDAVEAAAALPLRTPLAVRSLNQAPQQQQGCVVELKGIPRLPHSGAYGGAIW